ncbi:MAG TPA: polysaccharide biosynthesis C-terminal domain-containing protein [Clostridia bacterium]
MNVDWFFQGTEEYKYITIRSTVIKVLSLIAVFLFVNDVNDYIFYAGISCVAIAGNNILNIIGLIKKKIKISFKRLNITSHLKPVLILLCTTLSIELYTLFDTTMIGALCDDAAVGYYTNSMRIVKTVIALIAAVGGVLLPRLSMYYSNGEIDKCKETVNKVLNLMLFFIIPAGVGIGFCASEIIILMYGKAFSPAILTLQIGSLLVYVLGLSNLFGTQILLTFKDEKKLLIATIIGAVSNLVMNYFFIKLFAQNGAVVASIISELLVTLITLFYASKHIKISISKKGLLSSVISTIIMIIFILILKIIIKNLYVLLALEVIIGFSVYFVMALITKNPALYEAINAMKQIIKPDRDNSV